MNEVALSDDLNVITAEINSYKQVAGQSIFEIGRRLKHVKENDLVHGEWESYCNEQVKITPRHANRYIKVVEELGSNQTSMSDLGINALYQIATLSQEEREKEHTLSSGETKTVDDMTGKELQEVKRQLKLEQKERKRLERENEELAKQEPIIQEREVIKEVIPEHIKRENIQLQQELNSYAIKLEETLNHNQRLKDELDRGKINKQEYETMRRSVSQLSEKRTDLQQDIEDIEEIISYIVEIDKLKSEAMSPIAYSKAINRQSGNADLMSRLNETVSLVERWCSDLRRITGRNSQIIDVEGS